MPDFGADGLMLEIPETWSKETEYILDLTKGYHNLLQWEEDGNVQSYVWDSGALFMEDGEDSYSYLNDLSGSVMRLSGNGRDSFSLLAIQDTRGMRSQGHTMPRRGNMMQEAGGLPVRMW